MWLFCILIGMHGLKEFYRVFDISPRASLGAVGGIGAGAYLISLFLTLDRNVLPEQMPMLVLILAFLAIMALYVFEYPKHTAEKIMASYFGIIYVPFMLSFIYRTRMMENGMAYVWLIFLCSWGCDTCAYCVGVLIGQHKMAPVLSPKKSIEGAIGGVVGAALLGALYAVLMTRLGTPYNLSAAVCALICALGAMASMVGDLAASAIKRQYGIKDYGNLIPGHGGILDRFDSVIVTAPMIYILATLFG